MSAATSIDTRPRIYIAAPFTEGPRLTRVAADLEHDGFVVASRWHDMIPDGVASDPVDPDARRMIWDANMADLASADIMLVYTHVGRPRCTYVEIGFAIAYEKPIVWYQPVDLGRCLADADPHVTVVDDQTKIGPALRAAAKQRGN